MDQTTPGNLRKHAQWLGASYLSYVLLGAANTFFVKPGTYDVSTFAETADRFRIAQVLDLAMYCLVMVASWASYLVARSINRDVALLALLFRFGEGLLGCVASMVTLLPLVLLEAGSEWPAFEGDQLRTLATLFLRLSSIAWNILFVLMGIGAAIFMALFSASRYLPRWLTSWGLFTYGSMILYGLVKLGVSDPPSELKLIMYPGALFELVLGIWLLGKGISHRDAARQ